MRRLLMPMALMMLLVSSCSSQLSEEERQFFDALKKLPPEMTEFLGGEGITFAGEHLDKGYAVVAWQGHTNFSEQGKFFAFWVANDTVYSVNDFARKHFPSIPECPPSINLPRVLEATKPSL